MNSQMPCCRLCGSERVVFVGTKIGRSTKREFSYFRCRECAFLFVSPVLGPEIYDDDYYAGRGPDPKVDYAAEYRDRSPDREREYSDLFNQASKYFSRLPSVPLREIEWLDFGCGAGGFLRFLEERRTLPVGAETRSLNVSGFDTGSWAQRLAKDGHRILDFSSLQTTSEGSYDVISLIEVIEHIPNPAEVVRLLAKLLRPGGMLLLTTGNMHGLAARVAGLRYRYHMPEVHVSLLNPETLRRICREAGLVPLGVRYRGVVEFKVLKSAKGIGPGPWLRGALALPFVTRLIDFLYGVSAMPCAFRPLS